MKGFYLNRILKTVTFIVLLSSFSLFAGTTGKLAGKITDSETGEPVIGATITIEGTRLGAAANSDGYYYINNVPPGQYEVSVTSVGYSKTRIKDVIIKIDLTTTINVNLSSSAINVAEVVVKAERPLVQRDLTSSSATVSSSEITMMPVENINQIINLQAGVVSGHFRGGRSNEVAYLVDGIPMNDAFNNTMNIEIENSSIREMEIISGTFNAEYGQAMSGIVNMVMKEGSQNYEATASAYAGSYVTAHSDIFRNLNRIQSDGARDVQFSFSGPVPYIRDLTFFTTGRYFKDNGYLYGKRVYNVWDDVPVFPDPGNSTVFAARATGDGSYVPMNPNDKKSFNGKLTYNIENWKFSYGIFWDDSWSKGYDHSYAWTPDGIRNHYKTNFINNFQLSYVLSQSTFTTVKLSSNMYKYWGELYADELDPRYVKPLQGIPVSAYTFRSGGNQSGRYKRNTLTYIGQWALTSQISKEHKLGTGFEARLHDLYNSSKELVDLNEEDSLFTPGYRQLGTDLNQAYRRFPFELSAYVQDKMEYDIMIINCGLRLDYFNSNANLPTDLRNPANNPNFPGAFQTVKAKTEYQLSPRLGLSFPISDKGAIHFSYGHFFQIPSFENLYINPDYIISQGNSLSSITGNPNLRAQKTVKYELGLQQEIFKDISLDLSVYYSDIRNLLGMEIINTYEGFKYARFKNRDYGNVKGFVLSLDKRFADYFSVKLDYTFQIAEGNASDPYAVYNDNQTSPPVESEKNVVPLDWDQRSTLNISGNVGEPGDWNVGLVFQYGSGMPFTEDPKVLNGLRFENSGKRPNTFNVDLKADKVFTVFGFKINTFLLVYNLLDIKNEYGIYATTGRANVDLNTKYAGQIIGLNTMEEYVTNPAFYSAPRQIRVGFSFGI